MTEIRVFSSRCFIDDGQCIIPVSAIANEAVELLVSSQYYCAFLGAALTKICARGKALFLISKKSIRQKSYNFLDHSILQLERMPPRADFAGLAGFLMESGRYSDLKITCGGREFSVHRAIVCPQSEFFAAAIDGSFRESITRTVELDDDDPDDVARMMDFFYTSGYDDTGPSVAASQLINVCMYVVGEKFLMENLKWLALSKFQARCEDDPEWEWTQEGLRNVLQVVYTSTLPQDRGLRDYMPTACIEYERKARDDREGFRLAALESMLEDYPEANVDVLNFKLFRVRKDLQAEIMNSERLRQHAIQSTTELEQQIAALGKVVDSLGTKLERSEQRRQTLVTKNALLVEEKRELEHELSLLRIIDHNRPRTGSNVSSRRSGWFD